MTCNKNGTKEVYGTFEGVQCSSPLLQGSDLVHLKKKKTLESLPSLNKAYVWSLSHLTIPRRTNRFLLRGSNHENISSKQTDDPVPSFFLIFFFVHWTQICNPPVLVTVMSKIKQIIYEHIQQEGHHKSTGYHRACATVPKVTLFGLRLTGSIFIID